MKLLLKPKNYQLLAGGFALALALLGAVAWHGWRHVTRQQETAEWVAHSHKVSAQIARMEARGGEMLLAARSAAARREAAPSRWMTAAGGAVSITLFVAVFALLLRENRLRQRANLAVNDGEESLNVTLHSIGDAVLATDAAGRITRLNPVAEALTGWPQAEAVGRPAAEVFHIINEESRQPASIPLANTLAKGTFHGLANHTLLIARDGTERPIADSCAPIRNRAGEVIGAVLVFREVTEQREHEAALRRAHEELEQRVRERTAELELERSKLATAFGNTPTGLVLSNAQGGDIVMNAAAERMHGFASREDMHVRVGDYAKDWELRDATGRLLPFAEWPLPRAIAGDYCRDWELHLHNLKSGYQWDCSYTAVPVSNRAGEVSLLVITLVDITKRKGAAAALREAKERLETASVAARVALWDWDIPSGALEWSGVVDSMLGYEAGGLPRSLQAWEDLIHPGDRPTVTQALTRHLEHGTPYDIEYRVRKCDGTYVWWHDAGSCRRAANDQARRMSGACCDITGRKQAETEINALNASLEQRVAERTTQLEGIANELSRTNAELAQISRLKDDFLANMSHELRTPLNSILGLSEALLEQFSGPLTDRQIKSLTTISNSGQHLLALINDILDLSKIEAGKLELNLDTVSVPEFCESCLVFVRTQAMQKHIGVAFEHDNRAAQISADPKRLKQILVNLLTNAVKFTPEGGRIGLTVATPAGEETVRFTVWDTGIGIAPAHQTMLFKAFTQIDSGLNRGQEGTGLGLALVAKLVELHGGSVALESEPANGSRFIVSLPLAVAPLPPVPAGLAPSAPTGPTILLAEDNEANLQTLGGYLKDRGYVVHYAHNGLGAIELARELRPALIVMNIQMPVMDGLTAIRKIRADAALAGVPIVALTAVTMPGDRERCLAAGASDYLCKPVSPKGLEALLEKRLPQAGLGSGI